MSATAWRRLLLGLCALGFLLTANAVWTGTRSLGLDPGTQYSATSPFWVAKTGESPFLLRFNAPAGSAAYRQGLRTGDVLDLRLVSPGDRYRWLSYFRLNGQRLDIPIERDGKRLTISLVVEPSTILNAAPGLSHKWDVWLAYLGFVWSLTFAAVIAWRRSDNKEARVLSALLSAGVVGSCFTPINWVTPWPELDAVAAFAGSLFGGLSAALLATYAMAFAPAPNNVRRALMWLSYLAAAAIPTYGLAFIVGAWTGTADPAQGWYAGAAPQLVVSVLSEFLPVLCAIAAIVQTRGTDRARLVWVTWALGFDYLVYAAVGVAVSFGLAVNATAELFAGNIVGIVSPVVLTYVVLSRRILDIGFALNRAVVFSVVSLVFVAAFLLVEWGLGEWLSSASHTTNLVVGAAIALALGLSVRSIHMRVDRVLDTIFFRKRHEDEHAIRAFAHEAAYITDPALLLSRTKLILEEHADASDVEVLLDDGRGHYGTASENDPAIVALKAWQKSVDLHAIDTALHGEFAYPMVARGHLLGAIVIGAKRSGDPYAPDESAAISHLAHGVGGAFDVLSANGRASTDGLLEAIATMSGDLRALTAEVRAALQRPV